MEKINFYKRGSIKAIASVFLLILVLVVTMVYIRNNQNPQTSATAGNTRIILSPNQSQLPATIKVYVDPSKDNRVVFAKVKLTYPKNELILKEANVSGDKFKNIISVSNISQNPGEVELTAGVDPSLGPVTSTTEFATLTFEQASPEVVPRTDNVQVVTSGSQVVVLPGRTLTDLAGFGTRLFTENPDNINADKDRQQKNLGLTLIVKQNSSGRDYLEATWLNIDSLERPNFLNFSLAVRTGADSPPLTAGGERRVQLSECTTTCQRNLDDVSSLPEGRYFVNLRGNFKQKIVVQDPRKFFTMSSTGKITLSP